MEHFSSGCNVGLSVNQSIPHGAWTKVQLDTESFDVGGEFDSAVNYNFTAKEAGIYVIVCQALFNEAIVAGKRIYVAAYKNGAKLGQNGKITQVMEGGSDINYASFLTITQLSKDDAIDMRVYHDMGAAKNLRGLVAETYMAIARVQ